MGVRVLSPLFKLVIEPEDLGELIPNKSWETGDAGGWTFEGSTSIPYVHTDNPRTGIYNLHFVTSYSSIRWGRARYSVSAKQLALLKGETVTFKMYRWNVITFVGGVGSNAYIRIDDGITSTDKNMLSTPYSSYYLISVEHTVALNATKVEFIIYWYKTGGGTIWHVDIDDMDAYKHIAGKTGVGEEEMFISLFSYHAIGQGTWALAIDSLSWNNGLFQNTSGNDGDSIDYKVFMAKGTYTLQILLIKGSGQPILDVDIDAVEVASWDLYSAAGLYNQLVTQTGIVIATAGLKTLTLRADGKNASSAGYYIQASNLALWRTA